MDIYKNNYTRIWLSIFLWKKQRYEMKKKNRIKQNNFQPIESIVCLCSWKIEEKPDQPKFY